MNVQYHSEGKYRKLPTKCFNTVRLLVRKGFVVVSVWPTTNAVFFNNMLWLLESILIFFHRGSVFLELSVSPLIHTWLWLSVWLRSTLPTQTPSPGQGTLRDTYNYTLNGSVDWFVNNFWRTSFLWQPLCQSVYVIEMYVLQRWHNTTADCYCFRKEEWFARVWVFN